jgi:hypothetical protein
MALATKTQSQNIFAKLKQKPANKVRSLNREGRCIGVNTKCRYVSTAAQRTQHGARYPSASICASIARRTTVTWVSTSRSCGRPTSTVRCPSTLGGSTLGTGADIGAQSGNGINCASSRWAATRARPSTSSHTVVPQRSLARTTRPNTPAMRRPSTRRS